MTAVARRDASGVAASIDFAPGAVQTPTGVTLIETSIAPPDNILDWSPVYAAEPIGLALGTAPGSRFRGAAA